MAQSRSLKYPEPVVQHMTQVASGAYSIKRRNQTLRLVSGTVWLTMDNEDYTLTPGQELHIPRGKYPAVVEVMSKEPVIFTEYDR
jgi:quercetin dioxygenase-like cupin family protein